MVFPRQKCRLRARREKGGEGSGRVEERGGEDIHAGLSPPVLPPPRRDEREDTVIEVKRDSRPFMDYGIVTMKLALR